MTEKLQALLDELHKLDEDTWATIDSHCYLGHGLYLFHDTLWVIQGIIQDAIKLKEWHWEVGEHKGGGYDARIYLKQWGYRGANDGWSEDNPAEALLEAYIEMIKDGASISM